MAIAVAADGNVSGARDGDGRLGRLERTRTSGIYRRHRRSCERKGRCECPYVVVWEHRGKQATETFRTYSEAKEAKGSRDAGDRRPVSRALFGEYFEEWIESYAGRTSRGFSETTRPEYRRPIMQHALPKWRRWGLAEIAPGDVRDLFGEMRRTGCSTSQVKKLRAALSALFATAVEDGATRSNPVSGVRIPAGSSEKPDEPPNALTRVELSMLLAAIPGEWRLFFEFLAHTGLRISEAVGLTWAHLDLGERPKVRVREQVYRGKRRKLKSRDGRRDVPLAPQMAERLLKHRTRTYKGEDRSVFASSVGSELIPGKVARRVLKPAGLATGLLRPQTEWEDPDEPESWVTFHTFRHTCASLLFAAGKNVKQVQEWLGHADPAFTLRRYVHLMDEGVGDAAFLDEAVRVKVGSRSGPQASPDVVAGASSETRD